MFRNIDHAMSCLNDPDPIVRKKAQRLLEKRNERGGRQLKRKQATSVTYARSEEHRKRLVAEELRRATLSPLVDASTVVKRNPQVVTAAWNIAQAALAGTLAQKVSP